LDGGTTKRGKRFINVDAFECLGYAASLTFFAAFVLPTPGIPLLTL
jgi:hypothetical protein